MRALLRRFVGLTLIAVVLSALAGCETVGYYGQAIRGQAELLLARQRCDLIADPATPPALGTALRTSVDVLAFAESELGIAADGRYQSYVDLDRRAVVYNVFASPVHARARPVVLPDRRLRVLSWLLCKGRRPRQGRCARGRGLRCPRWGRCGVLDPWLVR